MEEGKIPTLIFHLAFVLILIGAAITRYLGEEGMMHIREGQTQNYISTSDYYLKVKVTAGSDNKYWSKKLLLSSAGKNNLNEKIFVGEKRNYGRSYFLFT
ncbi:MAG: cytochrome c biogenesis protein ResB [Bacteroidales bacterium]|nr:cytochrome c biogenesis protein ResB [Bacteroidales bacterium]